MVETDEPTFDVEEFFNELFPEPNYLRMEEPNASHQQDELIGILEESYQVAKPTSGENSNMSRNPEITFGYGSVAGHSNYPVEERFPNTMVSQPDQQHLLYQQLPAQFVDDTTNNFQPSAQLNAYLTDNQRQKQQTLFRNMSPSFTMRSQESCTSDAQQGMEPQLISQQWQMENALSMQNQFPQSQNVRLAHPMKSENDPRHFLQGPPLGGPFEAPWESTTQVKKATSGDWVEDAIHQIRYFRDIHLTDVVTLYNRASELRNQTQDPRTVLDCEHAMHISKSTHTFLHLSRADIFCEGKETFSRGMNCLHLSLDRIRQMNFNLTKHDPTSSSQQRESVPKFYCTSPSLVQKDLSSQLGSVQVGSSSGIENYALSSPHNSSLTGYEQGFSNMPLHSSTGVPQQLYMSDLDFVVASSQNTDNVSISPITQNSRVTNTENNNHSNVIKSTEQLVSERHMQQIMQKSNGNSAVRHFMTFNKSSSYDVPSPQSSSLTELSKFRTSSLSASKSTSPSTLNPLTPSSKRVDSEQSLLSFEKDISPAQRESQLKDSNQSNGVMDSKELRTCLSDFVVECTCTDQGESLTDNEDPSKRSTKVVKSMPPKESNPTVHEMRDVANIKDRTMDTVNDLATGSRKCKDQENCKLFCGTNLHAKTKRQMDSSDSRTEMEARASNMVKKQRKQVSLVHKNNKYTYSRTEEETSVRSMANGKLV